VDWQHPMTDQITVLSPRKQIDRRTTFLDVESQQLQPSPRL
jgi:hypothetical protein